MCHALPQRKCPRAFALVSAGGKGAGRVLEDDLFLLHVDPLKNYAEPRIDGFAKSGHASVDERSAVGTLKHPGDFHAGDKRGTRGWLRPWKRRRPRWRLRPERHCWQWVMTDRERFRRPRGEWRAVHRRPV